MEKQEKRLTNKALVSRLMDMAHIDRIVINDHAVTVRMEQSRVDRQLVKDKDYHQIVSKVGQESDAIPMTREVKGKLEMWIHFNRY